MGNRITIVRNDEGDWVGVYIDGELKYENHSIRNEELLDIIGIEYDSINDLNLDQYGNHLPQQLSEIAL
jgi:hypothetical protein